MPFLPINTDLSSMQIPEIAQDRLNAAITYLNDEIKALKQADTPEMLSVCLEGIAIDPPLPLSQFEDIISQWKFLPVPKQLVDTASKWKQTCFSIAESVCKSDKDKQNVNESDSSINQTENTSPEQNESVMANGEASGLYDCKQELNSESESVRAHRKAVMLDILSKITSVAESKGFKLMNGSEEQDQSQLNFLAIQNRVNQNQIHEWDIFTQLIYQYCQQLIAGSETDVREKGLELFHFARTLTESLRHISAQKESELRKSISDDLKDKVPIQSTPNEHVVHSSSDSSTKTEKLALLRNETQKAVSKMDSEFSETKPATPSECWNESPRSQKGRRKRKAVLQATRMSSRQQKRRAQIAETTQNEDLNAKSESSTGAEDEAIEEPLKKHSKDQNGEKKDVKVEEAPVLLTKTGRPRKKPGRKPGKRKH